MFCIVLSLLFLQVIKSNFLSPKFLILLFGINILSFTWLFLHVKSLLEGYRAKITYLLFLPLIALFFVYLLNYFDISLLNFSTKKEIFYGLKTYNKSYYTDTFFVKSLFIFMYIMIIFFISKKHVKKSEENKKKNYYVSWLHAYLLITIISNSILLVYYFNFFDSKYDTFLRSLFIGMYVIIVFFITKNHVKKSKENKKHNNYKFQIQTYFSVSALSVGILLMYYFSFFDSKYDTLIYPLSMIFFIFIAVSLILGPNLLFIIPTITKPIIPKLNNSDKIFKEINELIINEDLFLIKDLKIDMICNKTDLNKEIIILTISDITKEKWRSYINSLRVDYAINLIKTDYLNKHSIVSLGDKSGFNSHQTFFRAFKIKTGTTPGEFHKKRQGIIET
jgi:AraC-like DNA-binding protein/uncharacterized membrane protein